MDITLAHSRLMGGEGGGIKKNRKFAGIVMSKGSNFSKMSIYI